MPNYKAYFERTRHLIEAIAEWERHNGTVCAILPHEALPFTNKIRIAAANPECSARAALSALIEDKSE